MKIIYTLLLLLWIPITNYAQAELVFEFVPGPDGTTVFTDFTGTYNQATSVKLNDEIIIFSAKGDLGQELYKVENVELFLVKDLLSGDGDSKPQYFTIYEDLAYFHAIGDDGARIYSTDGSAEGTMVAFDLGDESTTQSDFSEFLIGRDGRLYFAYENDIYTYFGNELQMIDETTVDLRVFKSSNPNDYFWALYKTGIITIGLKDGDQYLYSIIDNQVEELVQIPVDGSFDTKFALESFDGGAYFSIESFDENVEGDYVFSEESGTLTKIGPGGSYYRSERLGDNACIISGYNGGVYLFDNDNMNGKSLNNDFSTVVTGENWKRERLENGVFFAGSGGIFDDTDLFYVENNADFATKVHTNDEISKMKTDGSYTFYFGESEQGDSFSDEDLFVFNHNTKTVSSLVTLTDLPFSTRITPLGTIANELYFFGIMNDEIGKELYKIDIGFSVSTKDITPAVSWELVQNGDSYIVSSSEDAQITIKVITLDGKLLEKISAHTNRPITITHSGFLLISVAHEDTVQTFKIYR